MHFDICNFFIIVKNTEKLFYLHIYLVWKRYG